MWCPTASLPNWLVWVELHGGLGERLANSLKARACPGIGFLPLVAVSVCQQVARRVMNSVRVCAPRA